MKSSEEEKETNPSLTRSKPKKTLKSRLTTLFVIYLMIGLVFAILFAKYYHWPVLGYFSPGFYFVILTWPFQLLHGFLGDLFYYGIQGPPFGGY